MGHDVLGLAQRDTPLRALVYAGLIDALVWVVHVLAFGVFILADRNINALYVTIYLHAKLWAAANLWAMYQVAIPFLAPSANNTVWYYITVQLIRHCFAALSVTLSLFWRWQIRQVLVVYCLMGLIESVVLVAVALELRAMFRLQRRAVSHREN